MVVALVALATAQFKGASSSKLPKIIKHIAVLLLFVSGMGLLARIGVSHGAPWPMWVKVKVAIWVTVALAFPIFVKKCPTQKRFIYPATIVLILIAMMSAVLKY